MTPPPLLALLDAFRDYVAAQAPHIDAFCGGELQRDLPYRAMEPVALPVCDRIAPLSALTCPATQGMTDAVIAAIPGVVWRQSYSEEDGFDAHYFRNYGWFNLIAPSGPFVSERLRLSIGYWGQGLHYPIHRHAPEEIYLTLAGTAEYISDGRAPLTGPPGATIAHVSNQPHGARMRDAPLLAAAFWRGEGLETRSTFDP